MTLSIIFGEAFEADPVVQGGNIRVYTIDEHTYIGHDTSEIVHVCDNTCLIQALPNEYAACDDSGDHYVSIHPFSRASGAAVTMTFVRTADVVDFDPGDDPYVLCAACKAELRRDEDLFEEQYGRRIGEVVLSEAERAALAIAIDNVRRGTDYRALEVLLDAAGGPEQLDALRHKIAPHTED